MIWIRVSTRRGTARPPAIPEEEHGCPARRAAVGGMAKATILQACDHNVLTWANVAAAVNMRTYLA